MRKKGRGPKPKDQRRKRVKKEVVKETPKAIAPKPHIENEQFEWRTKDQPPSGESRTHGYGQGRSGWKPRPPQPTWRTLEEAVISSLNLKVSAPIPSLDLEVDESKFGERKLGGRKIDKKSL